MDMRRRRRRWRMWMWLIILAGLGGLVYVRLAPYDPLRWHVDPLVVADQDLANGVRRRVAGDEDLLVALDGLIVSTPRTIRQSGSVAAHHITYVTRSQWMGFPDYTTVKLVDGQLEIWGRQRFGLQDLGTNRTRVDGWLAALTSSQD